MNLKAAIKSKGVVLDRNTLKVDKFLNHQVDPILMNNIGEELVGRFRGFKIDKVLTIESSGIPPAFVVSSIIRVPLVYAKKSKSTVVSDNVFESNVYSFTKKESSSVVVSKDLLNPEDNVLIIDDFLSSGQASLGLVNILEQAGATVVGIGVLIEKSFEEGRSKLEGLGYRVEALVRIKSLSEGYISFL